MAEQTVVDALVERARQSPAVVKALDRLHETLIPLMMRLDQAIAKEQTDPDDVGERIARSLVLIGAADNILKSATRKAQDRNAR